MSDQAAATAAMGDPITAALAAGFEAAALEPAQVDDPNADVVATPPPAAEPPKEEPAKVDEPEGDKSKEGEKADDKKEPDADKDEEGTTDEGELSDADADYVPKDVEDLKATWPRSVPLNRINQAMVWADGYKQGKETLEKIGGEPFVEPLSKMSTALRDASDNPLAYHPFFEGIIDAGGDEALRKVIGQSVYMAFKQAVEWQSDPATQAWGEELLKIRDTALQERFNTTPDRLDVAVSWDADGSIDKIDQFLKAEYNDEYGSFDENKFFTAAKSWYDEVKAIRSDPVKQKLAEENTALRRQQEKPADEKKAVSDKTNEKGFHEYAEGEVEKALNNIVWKSSPLKDAEGDTAEMKKTKAFYRGSLIQSALRHITDKAELRKGYSDGRHRTAVYASDLATALDAAIRATNADKLTAEENIASLYGKQRNPKLASKTENGNPPPAIPPATPTVPTDFKPKAGEKSIADIEKDLAAAFV